MSPSPSALLFLAASGLVLGLLAVGVRRRRAPRRAGFLEIAPGYRAFFRRRGLTDAKAFLTLPGATPHIVSGHPDRHVARVYLDEDGERWTAYLKLEHHVRWRTRLANALAGFGFVSRSVREAGTLQALRRENVAAPQWLASGEDDRGRAFVLVREVMGVELRAVLRDEKSPARRRRIARNLGDNLARLHSAGFRHPDLYANHIFVDPTDDSIRILDWQRARLSCLLSWRGRRRDLVALHATLDDTLATPRERLQFLRAYRRASSPLGVSWRVAARGIEAGAKHLLARRHIREKRQPPTHPQAWIRLEAQTLYVTPEMRQRCGAEVPDWLRMEGETFAGGPLLIRRWPSLPGEARGLLVRQRQRGRFSESKALRSTAQRQASVLLRLQRHGIPAPRVLALGQGTASRGENESLLLTEPLTDTCSLEAWLARRTRRRALPVEQTRRWHLLRQVGAVLRRLHEAYYYLNVGPAGCGLVVRPANDKWVVGLDRAEAVSPSRRRRRGRAARDLRRLQHILHGAGCSRTDLCRFRAGYRQPEPKDTDSARNPRAIEERADPSTTVYGSLRRRIVYGVRRLCQRSDWPQFAGSDWADRIMDGSVTDRFHAKQGRSTARWILHSSIEEDRRIRQLSVFVKRHHELPAWQRLLATLWPRPGWSPALREWRHLQWARRQGVPVPEVIAAAEFIGPLGRLRSFLAVEELAGMLSLQEAIPLAAMRLDAQSFRLWKRTLAAEMARLTRMLHDRRCFHKDLYLCHFFIAREDTSATPATGWRGRVYLIDLHRLAHHPLTWRFWQTKDLAQILYASEIVGVDARDRLYFWRAYRGAGPNRPRCAWVRRAILYRWMRYRHHNARNGQPRQDGREAA